MPSVGFNTCIDNGKKAVGETGEWCSVLSRLTTVQRVFFLSINLKYTVVQTLKKIKVLKVISSFHLAEEIGLD